MIELLGHLHPMLVHLPIGFIVILVALETAALFPAGKHLVGSSRAILLLTVPAAAASVICGWVLERGGGYSGKIVVWHMWLGTGVGALSILLLLLHWLGPLKVYRVALYLAFILICITGHLGGLLSHGSNYFSLAPEATATTQPADTRTFYGSAIQPLFNRSCIQCHGPNKSKAKLKLDSAADLLRGGESGPVFVPGNSQQSLLIKRLLLATDEDDHMPPPSKRQPTGDEIRLLQWWISSGASTEKTPAEMNPPEDILQMIQARAQMSERSSK